MKNAPKIVKIAQENIDSTSHRLKLEIKIQ